jgi:hypothetical protein
MAEAPIFYEKWHTSIRDQYIQPAKSLNRSVNDGFYALQRACVSLNG